MFSHPFTSEKPGLFITGTDTGVGKTVITCAIASHLSRAMRVGVCKPLATGCRMEHGRLISEDAEALVNCCGTDWPLDLVSPVRFAEPLAPAVAAEQQGTAIDLDLVADTLKTLNQRSDAVLVEGIGGLLVPITSSRDSGVPQTVLDLIVAIDYPVIIVARSGLGTLNHTGMTVRLLREAGCRVAGLVINGKSVANDDPSMQSNTTWLRRITGAAVLAVVPRCDEKLFDLRAGRLPSAVSNAVSQCHWAREIDSPADGATSSA